MKTLFHITTGAEAEAAAKSGSYEPDAFGVEGFVHCSYAHQVVQVANARFIGRGDLVLLELDPTALGAEVIEENLEGGDELFPHVYGPIPMVSVRVIHRFPCDDVGRFVLPAALRGGSS